MNARIANVQTYVRTIRTPAYIYPHSTGINFTFADANSVKYERASRMLSSPVY